MENSSPVRVRFAPSPTGFLHIGGVRTALYNWLYARHHNGQFMLRIEDTDVERSEKHFTDDILSSMKWLGLTWDEELTHQSNRLDTYRRKAQELVEKGLAYLCYCSESEIEEMREKALKEGRKPQYDRRCREMKHGIQEGKPYVIRAKIPIEGDISFSDLIHGNVTVSNRELDDFVLVRSNGAPTYNFTVVVDDVAMGMTHIIRGDDHINNTPKQIHLYRFFEYKTPTFAHLPMILGPDKKKLSKRHGAVSANWYRGEGYLPEALLNFLVRLGWSHGDQEVFSFEEMIQFFDFDHVQKSAAVFNVDKLLWMNGEHMRKADPVRLAGIVAEDFKEHFSAEALSRVRTPLGHKLIALIQPKVKLVKELAEQLTPLCTPGVVAVDASGLKWAKSPETKSVIQAALRGVADSFTAKMANMQRKVRISGDEPWGDSPALEDAGMHAQDIDVFLREVCTQRGIKLGDLAQPLRLAVTGRSVSAGLFELLSILPWDVIQPRLRMIEEL